MAASQLPSLDYRLAQGEPMVADRATRGQYICLAGPCPLGAVNGKPTGLSVI